MLVVALSLLACWPEATPSEPEIYLSALSLADEDPAEAARLCVTLSNPGEAGDCVLFAARVAAQRGDGGLELCDLAEARHWREACVFEIADLSGLTGDPGREACERSGAYRENCTAHRIQREVDQRLRAYVPGTEGALEAELRTLLEDELPGHDPETEARVLTAAAVAEKAPHPFERAACGESGGVCLFAYAVRAQWETDGGLVSDLCPGALPPYADDAIEVARVAEHYFCDPGHARELANVLGRWRMRRRKPSEPYGASSPLYAPTPSPTPPPR